MMMLAILFSLKTTELLQNGVETHFQTTPLFLMRTVLVASSQSHHSVNTDTWCKRALTKWVPLYVMIGTATTACFLIYIQPNSQRNITLSKQEHGSTITYIQTTFYCMRIAWKSQITGHAASIRHEDQDTTGQFEMIELPLKGEPSCIAVGKSLGGIGVAVDDTMLIYAYAQKRIADSDQTYRCVPVQ